MARKFVVEIVGDATSLGNDPADLSAQADRVQDDSIGSGELLQTVATITVVFRYLLQLPDGEPNDPPALVTMIPNWTVGETFTLAHGASVRIVAIDTDINQVLRRRFAGVFTVEPVDD